MSVHSPSDVATGDRPPFLMRLYGWFATTEELFAWAERAQAAEVSEAFDDKNLYWRLPDNTVWALPVGTAMSLPPRDGDGIAEYEGDEDGVAEELSEALRLRDECAEEDREATTDKADKG